MEIHKLALFWRAQQGRCFTWFHVQVKAEVRAIAQQIVAALSQLSQLQVYGAVLDAQPLPLDLPSPPQAENITQRLEINIYPAQALAPRHGITLIKFSIPEPVVELVSVDLEQPPNWQLPGWQLLEAAIFPYLCLPIGIPVKTGPQRIKSASLNQLAEIPPASQSPLAAALAATEQDLAQAQAQQQDTRSNGQVRLRVNNYQTRLAWLKTLAQLEPTFLSAAQKAAQPALVTSRAAMIYLPTIPARKEQQTVMTATTDQTATTDNYLPIAPAASAAQLWQDVPPAHFTDSAWWLHRTQLKQLYAIQERSYFRWLQKLQVHGLSRLLPAQQDQKVKLFYRPDVESAVANLSATQPRLGRPAQVTSTALPDAARTAQISPPQLAPDQLTTLQDQISALSLKQDNQAQAINAMNNQLAQLNAQLALLTTQAVPTQAAESLPRALEIIAQALDFNKLNAKLLALIKKLSAQLPTPTRRSNKARKAQSKAKTKEPKTQTNTLRTKAHSRRRA